MPHPKGIRGTAEMRPYHTTHSHGHRSRTAAQVDALHSVNWSEHIRSQHHFDVPLICTTSLQSNIQAHIVIYMWGTTPKVTSDTAPKDPSSQPNTEWQA